MYVYNKNKVIMKIYFLLYLLSADGKYGDEGVATKQLTSCKVIIRPLKKKFD